MFKLDFHLNRINILQILTLLIAAKTTVNSTWKFVDRNTTKKYIYIINERTRR